MSGLVSVVIKCLGFFFVLFFLCCQAPAASSGVAKLWSCPRCTVRLLLQAAQEERKGLILNSAHFGTIRYQYLWWLDIFHANYGSPHSVRSVIRLWMRKASPSTRPKIFHVLLRKISTVFFQGFFLLLLHHRRVGKKKNMKNANIMQGNGKSVFFKKPPPSRKITWLSLCGLNGKRNRK